MPSFATSPAVGESVNDEEPSAVFVVGFGFGYVRGLLAVSAVVDGDADYFGTGVFDGDEKAVAVLAGAGVFDGVGGQFAGEQNCVVLAGVAGEFLGDEATDLADGPGAAGEPAGAGRLCRMEGVGSVQAHRGVTSRETAHSRHELRD